MIPILRLLGIGSSLLTLLVILTTIPSLGSSTDPGGRIIGIVFMLIWSVLWFFLAHKLAARREARTQFLLEQPCVHCGSLANAGYRVCVCGRVRHPELVK